MKELKILCAWCEGSETKTKEITSQGYDVSHGICNKCYELEMEIIDKVDNILKK